MKEYKLKKDKAVFYLFKKVKLHEYEYEWLNNWGSVSYDGPK